MIRRENHLPLIGTATALSLAILFTFQVYQWREPSRLQADTEQDQRAAVQAGRALYAGNCARCHGEQGLGAIGPALNSKSLLSSVTDEQLFGLIRTGVPGTGMPAWSQSFGGPLTDEEIRQVVAFIRAWAPGAPDAAAQVSNPDPVRGAEIFESICFICHGRQGAGTERAPALNDPSLLTSFDDDWFRETIAQGRPSKGMPTWGTVLSPADIDDLVALFALWREGSQVEIDSRDGLASPGDAIYAENCATCHGPAGEGGLGPALLNNPFIAEQSDAELVDFILAGRTGTAMMPFEGRLSPDELTAVVAFLRSLTP